VDDCIEWRQPIDLFGELGYLVRLREIADHHRGLQWYVFGAPAISSVKHYVVAGLGEFGAGREAEPGG
jgi:hypothetical protein